MLPALVDHSFPWKHPADHSPILLMCIGFFLAFDEDHQCCRGVFLNEMSDTDILVLLLHLSRGGGFLPQGRKMMVLIADVRVDTKHMP